MSLFGETISVSEGALRTASGTLAGAHLELSGAVRNATAMLQRRSPARALRMCAARRRAEFLGEGCWARAGCSLARGRIFVLLRRCA